MSSSPDQAKRAADVISAAFVAMTIFTVAMVFQAWLLTLILPWITATVSLSFFQALIICTFLNLLFK